RFPLMETAQQPAARSGELRVDEGRSPPRRSQIPLLAGNGVPPGQGGDHEAVPGGEHLFVPERPDPPFPCLEKRLPPSFKVGLEQLREDSLVGRKGLRRNRKMENVP